VRFVSLEIFATVVFAREWALSSRTCSFVQSRRFLRLATLAIVISPMRGRRVSQSHARYYAYLEPPDNPPADVNLSRRARNETNFEFSAAIAFPLIRDCSGRVRPWVWRGCRRKQSRGVRPIDVMAQDQQPGLARVRRLEEEDWNG
jgi:hypothetical protein